jgi:hypothetical protein
MRGPKSPELQQIQRSLVSARLARCHEEAAGLTPEIRGKEARGERTSDQRASSRQAMSLARDVDYKHIEDRDLLLRV